MQLEKLLERFESQRCIRKFVCDIRFHFGSFLNFIISIKNDESSHCVRVIIIIIIIVWLLAAVIDLVLVLRHPLPIHLLNLNLSY